MDSILTVITPAATHDLTVIETVKDELGITDTAGDTRLYRWINEASGFIRSYCNRVFAEETVEETFRFPYCDWGQTTGGLLLRRRPVSAIVSVTEDDTALTTDDWEMDPEMGLLFRLSDTWRRGWSSGRLVVRYTAGYPLLDGLPYGIETACVELIKHRHAARQRDPSLKRQEIPGELIQEWWVAGGNEDGVPASVRAWLDPYRDIVL